MDDQTELSSKFEALLGSYDFMNARLRHIDVEPPAGNGRINVRASYLAFRDGDPTLDDFLEVVGDQIVPFCLPRKEVLAAHSKAKAKTPAEAATIYTRLTDKARRLFIRAKKGSNRSGEAGEIVLFILLEWLLSAPQIVSKMYLKTSANMPIHGTDGIHVRYDKDKNQLVIYFGESKAYADLYSALDAALSSIADFLRNGQEKREIEIASDHFDAGTLEQEVVDSFLEYLDPYSEASNERVTVFGCLLVFGFDYCQCDVEVASEEIEAAFVEAFSSLSDEFWSKVPSKVKASGLKSRRFEFFLLPVPNAQEFRDKFQKRIGWV